MMSTKTLGASIKRKEDPRLMTGEAKFLDELVELRQALADIKANAAAYEADATKAAEGLKKLSKSLAVLRALK